jgi:putative tricarboxylic transport membrane protein
MGSAAFLLCVGIFFSLGARTLEIGRMVSPGPGFCPFWLALALIILSGALIIKGFREKSEPSSVPPALWKGLLWKKTILTLGALLLYAFLLESLGYILATFLLMFFLFRAIETQRWPVVILGSVVTSFITYIVFRLWLQVQLPLGLWGI